MILPKSPSRALSFATPVARFAFIVICGASALLLALAAVNMRAQQAAPAPDNQPSAAMPSSTATPQAAQAPASTEASQPAQTPASAPAPTPEATPAESQPAQMPAAAPNTASQAEAPGSITEDELRRQLVGKELFLRGGYLDNTLSFNEHGVLIGHSPQGSYTLSGIRIDKVRLTKHKVELDGSALRIAFSGRAALRGPHQGRGPREHHAEEKRSAGSRSTASWW